jgi:Uma2 family endonuclease
MASEPKHRLTVLDYLDIERSAETKSEFFGGEMFAMAGASHEHNVVVTNIVALLRPQLRSRGCYLYSQDMKVRTPSDLLTYPDVAVVCGKPQFSDSHRDTVLNPIVLIEVLSPSTKDYDRGTKFDHYRTIPSFLEYVLAAQDRPHVEHHARQASGQWLLTEIDGLDASFEIASIGCKLALAEVYEDVL